MVFGFVDRISQFLHKSGNIALEFSKDHAWQTCVYLKQSNKQTNKQTLGIYLEDPIERVSSIWCVCISGVWRKYSIWYYLMEQKQGIYVYTFFFFFFFFVCLFPFLCKDPHIRWFIATPLGYKAVLFTVYSFFLLLFIIIHYYLLFSFDSKLKKSKE